MDPRCVRRDFSYLASVSHQVRCAVRFKLVGSHSGTEVVMPLVNSSVTQRHAEQLLRDTYTLSVNSLHTPSRKTSSLTPSVTNCNIDRKENARKDIQFIGCDQTCR